MSGRWLTLVVVALAANTMGAAIYKWLDENGVTHYSATPPVNQKSQRIQVLPPPPEEEIDRARQKAERDKEKLLQLNDQREAESVKRGAPVPPPLPPNASTEYFTTTRAGISLGFSSGHLDASFFIFLRTRPDISPGALIEAKFENPLDASQPFIVTHTVSVSGGTKEDRFHLVSPSFHVLRCRNYEIVVRLYADQSRTELLGVHRQYVWSRIDSALVGSRDQLMHALAGRNQLCP